MFVLWLKIIRFFLETVILIYNASWYRKQAYCKLILTLKLSQSSEEILKKYFPLPARKCFIIM